MAGQHIARIANTSTREWTQEMPTTTRNLESQQRLEQRLTKPPLRSTARQRQLLAIDVLCAEGGRRAAQQSPALLGAEALGTALALAALARTLRPFGHAETDFELPHYSSVEHLGQAQGVS